MMKNNFIALALVTAGLANAQTGNVGVNTNAPTNTLDVNGTARVRSVATVTQPNFYASFDANGVLQQAKAQRIVASGVDTSNGPTDVAVNGAMTSYTDLGLNLNLSVPAGKKYGVNVFYSVPMGTVVGSYFPSDKWTQTVSTITDATTNPITYTNTTNTGDYNLGGYIGVGFFRNGTLMPEPTRKVTMPLRNGNTVQMTTINSEFTEVLDNTAGASALSVAYNLQGYIEHYAVTNFGEATGATVRFNMYSLPDPNYNWGRATISYILYELP